jgi:hypothetical protein
MRILGISAFYHDSAAALLVDGRIVAAAQEERFTRKKQDARFPVHSIGYCLADGGTKLDEVDYVVFYEKPFLKFDRLLETYIAFAPQGYRSFAMAIPVWIREKLFQNDIIRRELQNLAPDFDWRSRLLFTEHRALQGQDWLPGAGQYQLQRAQRAYRVHTGGRLPLLHGQRHRAARGRQLQATQERAEPGAQDQL